MIGEKSEALFSTPLPVDRCVAGKRDGDLRLATWLAPIARL